MTAEPTRPGTAGAIEESTWRALARLFVAGPRLLAAGRMLVTSRVPQWQS
jgi:hypothetical protein